MKYFLLTIISFISFALNIEGQCNRQVDSLVLVKFFNECEGPLWANKNNWLVAGRNISTWHGIKLNTSGCVESIVLPNNKIRGPLPDSMGLLRELKILSLPNNSISSLPLGGNFNNLNKLEEINLSQNNLQGFIDQNFVQFVNLRILNLGLNNLTGDLPINLADLKSLRILRLNQNRLNGNIPPTVGALTNLEELLLSQNELKGTLPPELGQLTNLKTLILSQNQITGVIPKELGNLSKLRDLYLDENQLNGIIPDEIGNLNELRELWLSKNQFSGTIPNQLSNLTKLRILLLNSNLLNGEIPEFIGNMKDLLSLNMSFNMLSGSIPESIGNLNNLLSLILSDNLISGDIPSSFGSLVSLGSLNLSNNKLSGEIPASLGNMNSLRRIYMNNNQLESCFPESFLKFCPLGESTNSNASGYNFRQNPNLIFQGDFGRWCNKEGWAIAGINSNAPLCEGSDLILSGNGGIQFLWSGPEGFSSVLPDVVINNIRSNQFGPYTLSVVNEYKCRDTITALISPVNDVVVSTNSPICEGDDIVFSASGGISYLWTGPGGFTSNLPDPVIKNATLASTGDYIVEIKTSDCTFERTVKVQFLKNGSILTENQICEGQDLLLNVDTGNSFLWTGPSGFSSTLKSPKIESVSQTNSGKYFVTIKNNDNCTFTLELDLLVLAKPLLELNELNPKCEGSTIQFSVNKHEAYLWTGPEGFMSTEREPVISNIRNGQFGTYNIVVTDQNNCTASGALELQQVTDPSATLLNPACEGKILLLQATGGISYLWSGPLGFQSDDATPEISNLGLQNQGIYDVKIKTEDCTIDKSIEVNIVAAPKISGDKVCVGDTLKLGIDTGDKFSWSGPANFISELQNPIISNTTKNNEGTYTSVVQKDNCVFDVTYDVKLVNLKQINISDFDGLCANDDKILLPEKIDDVSGKWSGNGVSSEGTFQFFNPDNQIGIQKLTFEPNEDESCVAILEKSILVSALSIVASEFSPSLSFEDDNGKILVDIKGNGYPISLEYSGPETGSIEINMDKFIIENIKSGVYFIQVQDVNGCTDSDTVSIRYRRPFYFLPNVVSSVSSSPNHSFYLKGSNVDTYNISIYNRWGSLLFEKSNVSINQAEEGWMPRANDIGVFVYIITFLTETGPIVLRGSVTVL